MRRRDKTIGDVGWNIPLNVGEIPKFLKPLVSVEAKFCVLKTLLFPTNVREAQYFLHIHQGVILKLTCGSLNVKHLLI